MFNLSKPATDGVLQKKLFLKEADSETRIKHTIDQLNILPIHQALN